MITAKAILDSFANGVRITTYELDYPRIIHGELMTHRVFSRNAASSRAIPISAMLSNIKESPAYPHEWGMNNPGMQSNTLADDDTAIKAKEIWDSAMHAACSYSEAMDKLKIHKQIANRITEAYQYMRTIVTSTEWDNWEELRNHGDADPTIHELARVMLEAKEASVPMLLKLGQWHLPYIERHMEDSQLWFMQDESVLDLPTAKMISVSCCAQVSYRKTDNSLEKAEVVYERLVGMKPWHASPFEHQATPMGKSKSTIGSWEEGVTHVDRKGSFWSGNFKGWIQNRQLM